MTQHDITPTRRAALETGAPTVIRVSDHILGVRIDVLTWSATHALLSQWAAQRESRYVCICNAHSVVEASRDAAFNQIVASADLVTADGAPVAWMLRRLGHRQQQRINGPDLMARYCAQATQRAESIFLYGSTEETLKLLQGRLMVAFPGLRIAGAIAPPFRPLTSDEDDAIVDAVNASGANIVWVGLGCPKQEQWMAAHRGRITAVMVGVGAAFDYLAGTLPRAPRWMQRAGLEWLYRLRREPRRLWRRYLVTNTLFIVGAARQLAHRLRRTGE
jgi:N-acetylglucosaminyldiphosphoundecaprenol N-acetyl-beta-D-mannosaminyltransferase